MPGSLDDGAPAVNTVARAAHCAWANGRHRPGLGAAGAMMRRYGLEDIALAHTAAIAIPSGWTVFTTDPGRYQPLGDAVEVFGLV